MAESETTKKPPQLVKWNPFIGCDPEFFFERKDGTLVGSEKVIPESGLAGKKFIRDGVQVEMNPAPNYCRANLGAEISSCFRHLKVHLDQNPDIRASFTAVVEVPKEELASLSEKSRTLGCAPSFNAHDKAASIGVNPATYRTRSAGGHLHFGLKKIFVSSGAACYIAEEDTNRLMTARHLAVPVLDIILGNTSVLLDRDPQAAERRKVYGRAGEFRLPDHGLEYRTLSNFWLRSYPLMSLVAGLGRMAISIWINSVLGTEFRVAQRAVETDPERIKQFFTRHFGFRGIHSPEDFFKYYGCLYGPIYKTDPGGEAVFEPLPDPKIEFDFVADLVSRFDMSKIVRAINESNVDLAWENFEKLKGFITDHFDVDEGGTTDRVWVLPRRSLAGFEFFAREIQKKGIERWFPEDPLVHWTTGYGASGHHGKGWEGWFESNVLPAFRKEKK